MNFRKKYYLFSYGGLLLILSGVLILLITDSKSPFLIFLFVLIVPLSVYYINNKLKCPKCHTRIMDFSRLDSKHFQGFHINFRLPDKCPNCGCDWE